MLSYIIPTFHCAEIIFFLKENKGWGRPIEKRKSKKENNSVTQNIDVSKIYCFY
jgi:hypothetical protein